MTLVQNPDTGLFEEVSKDVVEEQLKDTVDSSALNSAQDDKSASFTPSSECLGEQESEAKAEKDELQQIAGYTVQEIRDKVRKVKQHYANEVRRMLKHSGLDTQQQEKLFTELESLFGFKN